MIEIDITPSMQQDAIALSKNKNIDLISAYGETVVFDYLQYIVLEPEYDNDYNIRIADNTVDVKTKESITTPRPYYDYIVPVFSDRHPPSVFVFVSLLSNGSTGDRRFGKAWILGMIDYETLTKSFKLWKKGEVDPANGWESEMDCFKLYVRDLEPMI